METVPEPVVRQLAAATAAAPTERTESETVEGHSPAAAPAAVAATDSATVAAASEDEPAPVEIAMTATGVPAPARQTPAESAPAAEAEHENAASPSEPVELTPLEAAAPAEGPFVTGEQQAETEPGESGKSTGEQPGPEEIQPAVYGQAVSPETAEIGKPQEEKKPFAKLIPIAAGVVGGVSALGAGISMRMRRIRIRKGTRK
jgi:hypothetical protein